MLIQLLFSTTADFALTVLGAFVFFSAGLLYFDSWHVNKKKAAPLYRSIGFILLAIVYILKATSIDHQIIIALTQVLKVLGLSIILISLVKETILHIPKRLKTAIMIPFILPAFSYALIPLSAILFLLISLTYFRKAKEGLEKQLMPASISFLFLGLSEIISISFFWSDLPVVFWSRLLSQFGIVWNIEQGLELLGIIILFIWIWGYIRFRIQIQLFVVTIGITIVLFLTTTILFTFLLLRNLEADALSHLQTDLRVLQYSLDSLKEKTLAHAQAIAQDSSIQQALLNNDTNTLYAQTADYLIAQKTSTLVITSTSGEVVMRAEDKDRTNDNISSDPLIQSALEGKETAAISYKEGITVPEIAVMAAVPIKEGQRSRGKIIGVALTGFTVDSAFVDGVKAVTGLDTTIFGKDKRAATTFIAENGKSRFVGTLETNPNVLEKVLKNGKEYTGKGQVLNQPYYTAYSPLKSADDKIIGMLFIGKSQNTLTSAAKQSISLTFIGSVILLVLSLIPSYFFSRFLKDNLEA